MQILMNAQLVPTIAISMQSVKIELALSSASVSPATPAVEHIAPILMNAKKILLPATVTQIVSIETVHTNVGVNRDLPETVSCAAVRISLPYELLSLDSFIIFFPIQMSTSALTACTTVTQTRIAPTTRDRLCALAKVDSPAVEHIAPILMNAKKILLPATVMQIVSIETVHMNVSVNRDSPETASRAAVRISLPYELFLYHFFPHSDVNECTDRLHNCHSNAHCTNNEGSFMCTCKSGFTGSGTICEDVNECEDPLNNCSAYAICINKEGGYNCKCHENLAGDGYNCVGR